MVTARLIIFISEANEQYIFLIKQVTQQEPAMNQVTQQDQKEGRSTFYIRTIERKVFFQFEKSIEEDVKYLDTSPYVDNTIHVYST